MVKCSLIISTYNSPDYLNLCLKSVRRQVYLPNEIIIADDGSSDATKQLIDGYRTKIGVPIKHVWHEDVGFRKTIILNEAIRQSSCEYIIQIDGDVILEKHFIEDHLSCSEPGVFVRGTRALMTKAKSDEVLSTGNIALTPLSNGLENRNNAIRFLPLQFFAIRKSNNSRRVRGSNISFWKEDFITVNGYNNDLSGWGHEDEELAARFINNGILKKIVKFMAVQYHIYHPMLTKELESSHSAVLENVVQNNVKVCANGYKFLR
ncbi:glycosyltransferase family 2 protein [Paradesertivirga mongoliensis]|uniref:Glycosyltransferase family 2 protein n=1 Tax=Paradesertivirga mongoliensis TaxID=2100740 RepID=A0ABW4ZI79_9SPHI|nr:glycosyltransferase family 2 protein [Pedobacter mongoliensis]